MRRKEFVIVGMDDSVHPINLGKAGKQSRLPLPVEITVFTGESLALPLLRNIILIFTNN